jgi:hypothetical protein
MDGPIVYIVGLSIGVFTGFILPYLPDVILTRIRRRKYPAYVADPKRKIYRWFAPLVDISVMLGLPLVKFLTGEGSYAVKSAAFSRTIRNVCLIGLTCSLAILLLNFWSYKTAKFGLTDEEAEIQFRKAELGALKVFLVMLALWIVSVIVTSIVKGIRA